MIAECFSNNRYDSIALEIILLVIELKTRFYDMDGANSGSHMTLHIMHSSIANLNKLSNYSFKGIFGFKLAIFLEQSFILNAMLK